MFSFTAVVNDISMRVDPMADMDRGPYVPCIIGPSVILKADNLYPLAHLDGIRLRILSLVLHSRS